jgi:adenosine deaminase
MDYRHHNNDDETYKQLATLPKIELHRHLEGSLRLGTMAEIARLYQMALPDYEIDGFRHLVQMMPDDEPSADRFISKFEPLRKFYRSPEIIDRVTYEAVADAAADHVVYLELRFTPIALAREKGFPLHEVADWVIAAVRRAERDFGIDVSLIIMPNRHESVELAAEMIDIAIGRMDQGVVAVDLGGAENRFSGKPFAHLFAKAREAGLKVTVHAGEWAGPPSIRDAIDLLGATRLGHGVRVIEDATMMAEARERGIAFEVCPTSNLQSGVTPSLEQHPLRVLYQEGLLTTLNTDDPSVCGINLTDEMVVAVQHMGFSLDDIKQHILNAARVSFLPPDKKESLVNRLMAELYPAQAKQTETAA